MCTRKCGYCGRVTAENHVLCPWCGVSAVVGTAFNQLKSENERITEQRDKAWLLAEHREQNVRYERWLKASLAELLEAYKTMVAAYKDRAIVQIDAHEALIAKFESMAHTVEGA